MPNPSAEPRLAAHELRPDRLFTEWLAVGAGLSVLVVVLVFTGAVLRLDHLLYDYVAAARPLPMPDEIVIIGIDEASLARIGPWPWPRRIHAQALDRINAAGARAIAYDVLFTEPAADDAVLERALARSVPIVLPMQFRVPGSDGRGYDEMAPVVGAGGRASRLRIGHSSVRPDADGVVRTLDLALDGVRRWPHVAVQVAGPHPLPAFVPRPAAAPLLRQGERLIGYRGGPGRFRTIPFAALIAGEVPPELLAGRIVMVGATAAGLGDQFATPGAGASGVMPGVEIQANFVADLLQQRNLRRAGPGA
ncbi:MAG: CHASE2 domain-containing protein [Sandarakinorhabdus sp.]|nr:CHASE2 domain-containing protein [Sandarakinorhabdus sp.]